MDFTASGATSSSPKQRTADPDRLGKQEHRQRLKLRPDAVRSARQPSGRIDRWPLLRQRRSRLAGKRGPAQVRSVRLRSRLTSASIVPLTTTVQTVAAARQRSSSSPDALGGEKRHSPPASAGGALDPSAAVMVLNRRWQGERSGGGLRRAGGRWRRPPGGTCRGIWTMRSRRDPGSDGVGYQFEVLVLWDDPRARTNSASCSPATTAGAGACPACGTPASSRHPTTRSSARTTANAASRNGARRPPSPIAGGSCGGRSGRTWSRRGGGPSYLLEQPVHPLVAVGEPQHFLGRAERDALREPDEARACPLPAAPPLRSVGHDLAEGQERLRHLHRDGAVLEVRPGREVRAVSVPQGLHLDRVVARFGSPPACATTSPTGRSGRRTVTSIGCSLREDH